MIVKIDANSLLKRIDKMGSETNISAAIGKACALVEGEAKKKAPKDTGALRRSITSKVENAGSETQGVVFTPLEYAPYVELGARGRNGVHMLQRAAAEHADEYKQLMEDSMKNA